MTRGLSTCAVVTACLFLLAGCGGISFSPPTTADNGDSAMPPTPTYAPPAAPMGGAPAASGHGGGGGHGGPTAGMAQPPVPGGSGHGAGPAGYVDPAAGEMIPDGSPDAFIAAGGHGANFGGADPAAMPPTGAPPGYGPGPGHGADPAVPGGALGHGADPAAMPATGAPPGFGPGQAAGHAANPAVPGAGAGHAANPAAGLQLPGAPAGADPAAMERELAGQGLEAPPPDGGPGGALGYPSEGGRGSSQFDEGSPERAIADFVAAVNAGDLETAGKMVGSRATGQLAAIREGRLSDNQLQQLQSYFGTFDHIGGRVLGRTAQANFNGGSGKLLLFEAMKEREGFVVSKLTIRDAPTRRR